MILFYILFLIITVVFAIDFVPQFNTWQSRIKIGRYQNQAVWKTKVLAISKKWLFKTPTIKVTDNSRLIIIDILKGNYKRSSIQHWQEASLLLGLTQEYIATNNEETKAVIKTFLNSKINTNGSWKNTPTEIDSVILAYAIITIPFLDYQHYKPSFDAMYQIIENLKGTDGTVGYKRHTKSARYVDTIGFICPFLTVYGLKFNNDEAINLAVKQIQEFNKYALLNDTFIPCHTYNIETKLPVGLFGWGRGLGWYAIGLIDTWKALPETDSRKLMLTNNVISFAKMTIQFQENNGSWHWLISHKLSQLDSSTTATLAWFLANASQIESIHHECQSAKEKALNYLMKVTRRDGSVDFSQGDTKGIGIHSNEFDILPFTQGFCLRTLYI